MVNAWHYTLLIRLVGIAQAGMVRLCRAPYGALGEPGAVWVSTNREWEQTVRKTAMVRGASGELYRGELMGREELSAICRRAADTGDAGGRLPRGALCTLSRIER